MIPINAVIIQYIVGEFMIEGQYITTHRNIYLEQVFGILNLSTTYLVTKLMISWAKRTSKYVQLCAFINGIHHPFPWWFPHTFSFWSTLCNKKNVKFGSLKITYHFLKIFCPLCPWFFLLPSANDGLIKGQSVFPVFREDRMSFTLLMQYVDLIHQCDDETWQLMLSMHWKHFWFQV